MLDRVPLVVESRPITAGLQFKLDLSDRAAREWVGGWETRRNFYKLQQAVDRDQAE